MSIGSKVKRFALDKAINKALDYAAKPGKDPAKTIIKGMKLAATFTNDKLWTIILAGMRKKFEENHPMKALAVRFLTELNKEVRHRLVRNLFIDEALLGPAKRHKIEKKLGLYPPAILVISPTMACPLKCWGCYASEYNKDEQLNFEQVDSLINQAKAIGIHFITFTGGEPYFWKPLFDIFEKHRDCVFQTYTSGLLITDEMVDKLAKLGNVFPAISCEGFEEQTDRRRGVGAFKKVNELMRKLKERGMFFGYSATATRENMDIVSSKEFIQHWLDAGCLFGWYFIYMPIGREPNLDLMPTPEQRVHLSRRVKETRSTMPILAMDFWNDGEHAGGCIAGGRKYLHVNNKGDYEVCVFCHFAKDNIKDKTLAEALNGDFFREFRANQPFNKDLRRPCIMIDNPRILREVVAKTGARGTHPGATTLLNEFAPALDKYSEAFAEALKNGPVTPYKIHP